MFMVFINALMYKLKYRKYMFISFTFDIYSLYTFLTAKIVNRSSELWGTAQYTMYPDIYKYIMWIPLKYYVQNSSHCLPQNIKKKKKKFV